MKRRDSILQQFYMSKLPKAQMGRSLSSKTAKFQEALNPFDYYAFQKFNEEYPVGKIKTVSKDFRPFLFAKPVQGIQKGNRMKLNIGNDSEDAMQIYLEELSHLAQRKNMGPINFKLKYLTNDLPKILTGKNPYEIPGTIEYEAHNIISPKLQQKYGEYISDAFRNILRRGERKDYSGKWLNEYQDGGDYTKAPSEWYKKWYGERQSLPQFNRLASERLALLNTPPQVVLTPAEELNKINAVAEFVPSKGRDASKDIIRAIDPNTVAAFQQKLEAERATPFERAFDPSLGTNPSVIGHEMSHWLDTRAKQSFFRPKGVDKSTPYQKYPSISSAKFKETGLDVPTYRWISGYGQQGVRTELNAVLNELRQAEGLRGDTPTSSKQMQEIINKYINLPEDKLYENSSEGGMNRRIKTLINYLGQDPEKLSDINNLIVKGLSQQMGLPKAQWAGELIPSYGRAYLSGRTGDIPVQTGAAEQLRQAGMRKAAPAIQAEKTRRAQIEAEKKARAREVNIQAAEKLTPEQEAAIFQTTYERNKQIASQNPDEILFNYRTGETARKGDVPTGGDWGTVNVPAIVQSAALTTPSGSNIAAGQIGAETFVNMNPITAPIMAAGRATQAALGQDPYGFSQSRALGTLGVAGDVLGLGSYKLLPGSSGIAKIPGQVTTAADRLIFPTRAYRAEPVGGSTLSYEPSPLSQKVFEKGDWATKNIGELFEYAAGTPGSQGRPGLLSGRDVMLTEYKVPFWKRNIRFDKDVMALKESQGYSPMEVSASEYIIPKNKFLYPRRTSLMKAVPEELKTDPLYSPSSIPLSYSSSQYASAPYKYIQEQINAITGHRAPLTYEFQRGVPYRGQNVPMFEWKQPQFAPEKGVGKFSGLKEYLKENLLRGYKEVPKPTSTQSIIRGPITPPYSGNAINVGQLGKNVVGMELPEQLQPKLIDEFGNPLNTEEAFNKPIVPRTPSAEELALSQRLKERNQRIIDAFKNKKNEPPKKGFKEGGIIDDQRGQWAHPGKVTRIKGNTMATHGYGNIPLHVKADTGEERIVYPNTGTQVFEGATQFIETPIMQYGGGARASLADSLKVYNQALQLKNYYDTKRNYLDVDVITPTDVFYNKNLNKLTSKEVQNRTLKHRAVSEKNKQIIRENPEQNVSYFSDMITGAIDPDAPLAIYDERISPQGFVMYSPTSPISEYLSKNKRWSSDKNILNKIKTLAPIRQYLQSKSSRVNAADEDFFKELSGVTENEYNKSINDLVNKYGLNRDELNAIFQKEIDVYNNTPGVNTTIPYYDPIAVKPASLRTPEEQILFVKKYGNISKFKENTYPTTKQKRPLYQQIKPEKIPSSTFTSTPISPSNPLDRLKQTSYNYDKPTKYSFTYPTGDYNEQKTMYFPTKSMLQSFMQGARNVSSQEGEDYMTASGYMKLGGPFNSSWMLTTSKQPNSKYPKMNTGGWLDEYAKGGSLTPNKAREILHDKEVHGHPLTEKQRRFFGAMSKGHTNKFQFGGSDPSIPNLDEVKKVKGWLNEYL